MSWRRFARNSGFLSPGRDGFALAAETGTGDAVALIATVRAVIGSPTPKHFDRLMAGPFQVAVPGTRQTLFCHATGVISGLPAQGYLGRERPLQGVLRKCKLRNTPAPAPGSKKGGRSRPPPFSPCGRRRSGIGPQPQAGKRDRGTRLCKVESSPDVSDPRCLTYTPRSATTPHFSAVKISLHQPLRRPRVVLSITTETERSSTAGAPLSRSADPWRPQAPDRHRRGRPWRPRRQSAV